MARDRSEDPAIDQQKPGRRFSFTVPRSKDRGVIVVEGVFKYEGAEIELGEKFGELLAEMWREGKLWWDGNEFKTGPRPAPAPPPPLSKLDAAIRAFDASRNTEKLELIMRSIGSALDHVRENSSSLADSVATEAVEDTVEELLGSALLICQAHMNAVLHRIDALKPIVRRRKAVRGTLLAESHRSRELLRLSSPRMVGAYSLTELMWALAEYRKEQAHWPARWTEARADSKQAIAILSAAGVTQQTSHKLQAGVRMIGVSRYSNLDLLGVICDHWGNLLSTDIRGALGR